ncbi:MAG: adenine phosphoribosyltransferase [Myxococcales bacterium]|nr:MAG: adenine phosphoribosyltransferase [Myxococcales bacterium]
MDLKRYIRTVPNWPKPGVMFRDITTLLTSPEGFAQATDELAAHYRSLDFDKFAAIESRGFVFGAVLARAFNKPLVLLRKPGKLPAATERMEYSLEYGTDAIEVHKDAVSAGDRVVVIDDLLATGGTALAAIQLMEKLGGKVVEVGFVIDLPDVGGAKKLKAAGYTIFRLVQFEGD